MTRGRIPIIIALVVVLLIASLGINTYLVSRQTNTGTSVSTETIHHTITEVAQVTSTQTVTITSSSLLTSSANFTTSTIQEATSAVYSCVIQGAPIGVMVHLLSNTGYPLSGVQISGEAIAYCDGELDYTLQPATTNSSGWADLRYGDPGYYYLTLDYQGQNYTFTVPSRPVSVTLTTYEIPSGNLTNEFCAYGTLTSCSAQP